MRLTDLVSKRAHDPLRAVSRVFGNRGLRRLLLASGGFVAGEWAYTVGLAVYAYEVGGAGAVGLVGLIRMLPGAVAGPFVAVVADRYRREHVLTVSYGCRGLAFGASAWAVFGHAPAAVVFVLAALLTVVSAVVHPCQWSLIPVLSQTPEELAASNVTQSLIEGVSTLIGPVVAGVLLGLAGVGWVFVSTAVVSLAGALVVSRIRSGIVPRAERAKEATRILDEALGGLRVLRDDRNPRLLVTLAGAQTFVRGALNVLVVVAALELLDMGAPGVGYLTSAFGVGGLIGALTALSLVGRRRVAGVTALGLVLWGAPIALVAAWANPAFALVLLAIPGLGNAFFDIGTLTLLQRITGGDVLGRVFGIFEGVAYTGIGIGSIVAAAVVSAVGVRTALVAFGVLLPAIVLPTWSRLRRIDEAAEVPERELALLQTVPIFAPLPCVALEQCAKSLRRIDVRAGDIVIREGEAGDEAFVIAAGEVEVSARGERISKLGSGEYFGEIALLNDVARTATVRAVSDVLLYSIDRDDFQRSVVGHTKSSQEVETIARTRLEDLRTRIGSL